MKICKYFLFIAVFSFVQGCKQESKPGKSSSLVVSILPQEYFVKAIAGDTINIEVMVKPGQSPAIYEPSPAQMKNLHHAKAYLAIGNLGFEKTWLPKFETNARNLNIVDLSQGIRLKETGIDHHDHKHHAHRHDKDPHYWMSFNHSKKMAQNIVKAFSEMYPSRRKEFEQNLSVLENDIDSLYQRYATALESKKSSSFVIFHPALTYIAEEFELNQIPIELEGKTPGPSHVREVIDLIKKNNVGVIFIQKQFDQTNAELIAKETGVNIIEIDPLNPHWMKEMESLLVKLSNNL
jgi:zinc transport system substrate-binding protein